MCYTLHGSPPKNRGEVYILYMVLGTDKDVEPMEKRRKNELCNLPNAEI